MTRASPWCATQRRSCRRRAPAAGTAGTGRRRTGGGGGGRRGRTSGGGGGGGGPGGDEGRARGGRGVARPLNSGSLSLLTSRPRQSRLAPTPRRMAGSVSFGGGAEAEGRERAGVRGIVRSGGRSAERAAPASPQSAHASQRERPPRRAGATGGGESGPRGGGGGAARARANWGGAIARPDLRPSRGACGPRGARSQGGHLRGPGDAERGAGGAGPGGGESLLKNRRANFWPRSLFRVFLFASTPSPPRRPH